MESKEDGEPEKILRTSRETLMVQISPTEIDYRQKHLPDPLLMGDEKLVCTVCSLSLAKITREGGDIFEHRFLGVLVCEGCYIFYGDGCFSVDEDGYDKYCRWCGQGGSLYVCSTCTSAFCKKCVMQNMKKSALADLQNDEWKCYLCVSRPLFGCRTICWAAKKINDLGKLNKRRKLKKQAEKLLKMSEKRNSPSHRKRKSRKSPVVEDEDTETTAVMNNEGSDSSSISLPSKKIKLKTEFSTKLNGDHSSKHSRIEPCVENGISGIEVFSESEKSSFSSISVESVERTNRKKIKVRKKNKYKIVNSDDLSCEDSGNFGVRSLNHKYNDSDDQVSTKTFKNKSRSSRSNKYHNISDSALSDSSSSVSSKLSNNTNEKNSYKENVANELMDISQDYQLNVSEEEYNNVTKSDGIDNSNTIRRENLSSIDLGTTSELNMENNKDLTKSQSQSIVKLSEKESGDGNIRTSLLDYTLESVNEVAIDEVQPSDDNTEIEKNHIESAMGWLDVIINDISDLGTLVAMRANKFNEKKITEHRMKNYNDVLETFDKLKQLIAGVHTSYQQIEQSLESNLVPWKYLTGLENANHDKSIVHQTSQDNTLVENINNQNTTVQECNDQLSRKTSQSEEIVDFQVQEEVSGNDLAKSLLEEKDLNPSTSPKEVILRTESDSILDTNELANQLDTSFQGIVSECNRICSENKEVKNSELSLPPALERLTSINLEEISEYTENKPLENKNTNDTSLDSKEVLASSQTLTPLKKQENVEMDVSKCNKIMTENKENINSELDLSPATENLLASVNLEKSSVNAENKPIENKNTNDSSSDSKEVVENSQTLTSLRQQEHVDIGVSECNRIITEIKENISSELNLSPATESLLTSVNIEKSSEDTENKPLENKNTNYTSLDSKEVVENGQTLTPLKKQENVEMDVSKCNKIMTENKENITSELNLSPATEKLLTSVNPEKSSEDAESKPIANKNTNDSSSYNKEVVENSQTFSLKQQENVEIGVSVCNRTITENKENINSESILTSVNLEKSSEDTENKPLENKYTYDTSLASKEDLEDSKTLTPLKQHKNVEVDFSECNRIITENKENINSEFNLSPALESLSTSANLEKISDDAGNKTLENKNTIDPTNSKDVVENGQTLTPLKQQENVEMFSPNDLSASREHIHTKDNNCINEALQLMLNDSTDSVTNSSLSSTDDSEDIQIDDSDLEIIKARKFVAKQKFKSKIKKCENKYKTHGTKAEENQDKNNLEEIKEAKKSSEEVDSEAEMQMLTDISKLKKRTFCRKFRRNTSSSEERSRSDSDIDQRKIRSKGLKYNTEIKQKREADRNELIGFLKEVSSSGEADITNHDLDDIEDQYVSSTSDSMSLVAFSQKIKEKYNELEKQQEQMNLQILLAPESDEGSDNGVEINIKTEKIPVKKKALEKNIDEEKVEENEQDLMVNSNNNDEREEINDKMDNKIDNKNTPNDTNVKSESDEEIDKIFEVMAKSRTIFEGLESSTDESHQDNSDTNKGTDNCDKNIKTENLMNEDGVSNSETCHSDSSEDVSKDKGKKKLRKKSWRSSKLLRVKLSDTDTSDEERFWKKQKEKQKNKQQEGEKKQWNFSKRRHKSSDEENNKKIKKNEKEDEMSCSSTPGLSATESSGSSVFKKKKRKKGNRSDSSTIVISENENKKKKKKRRVMSNDSSDEFNNSSDDIINNSQKSGIGESPKGLGRKNIRKVFTKSELAAATKAAAKEEEERKKRIAARKKLFNEIFEIQEAEVLEKLVLDFDPDTKTELISVDRDLVAKMKPHQAEGVKFMWDSCFESLSQLQTKKGSGCILAHCMGLGKTFQVISLVHTILKHEDTRVKTVLVVCPLSTVLNWFSEFDKWLDDVAGGNDIKVYHLTQYKRPFERSRHLRLWHTTGGVMVMGYEMFRNLTNLDKDYRLSIKDTYQKTLIDPGADLVVCDEGHMLKNESTLLSKTMSRIKTLRRIVLTGTPMQNNLKEYHCMVQFVKPNLLGTRKEFLNQFVNPITNGQFANSTEVDVKIMKRRSHVLHKMLEGLVQRFDYSVLTPFLPPKHEYVISVRLSELQVRLYQYYLDNFSQKSQKTHTGSQVFQDYNSLARIWTHPLVLKMSTDKFEKEMETEICKESEEESTKNVSSNNPSPIHLFSSHSSISPSETDDNGVSKVSLDQEMDTDIKGTTSLNSLIEEEINLISSEEDNNEEEKGKDEQSKNKETKSIVIVTDEEKKGSNEMSESNEIANFERTDAEEIEFDKEGNKENIKTKLPDDSIEANLDSEVKATKEKEPPPHVDRRSGWWKSMVDPKQLEDINQSAKLILLFAILKECEMIEDKVLLFSQSLFSLDLVEHFLRKVDQATDESRLDESLGGHMGCWSKGVDYFRLDGSTPPEQRSRWCKDFNREDNPRARLFLISTKAGGLGINLTGANRVIIFDASWNPSHDIQSIFRIYRFGQKKSCYVYRFIASGTMEEKVYDRQVAKQSLSSRVVDEQQVQRHFTMNDLNELYRFTPPTDEQRETPTLPRDRLMAELFTQHSEWVERYHEHDSLLENVAEEELNEEERKLAWEDFQNEKKKGLLPPQTPGAPTFPSVSQNEKEQREYFRKSLLFKYPNSTDTEMNLMLSTLMNQVQTIQRSQQTRAAAKPQTLQATYQASTSQNTTMPTYPTWRSTAKEASTSNFNLQSRNDSNMRGQQLRGEINQVAINAQRNQENPKRNGLANDYRNDMRLQQEANLARIKNQVNHNSLNPKSQQWNNVQQQPVNRNQVLPYMQKKINTLPNQNRLPNLPSRRVHDRHRPGNTQTQLQNRQPPSFLNAPTKANIWKSTMESSGSPKNSSKVNAIQQTTTQSISNSATHLTQETVRNNIAQLMQQSQMSIPNRLAQKQNTQNTPAQSTSQQKELEEMRKRYAARKSAAKNISVVEIYDDEN